MLRSAMAIAAKDLRLLASGSGSALIQALLLGLLLIFLFSLSQGTGEKLPPEAAATMFWLSSLFCQTMVSTSVYGLEEKNGAKLGLLLLPLPVQTIWLGKALAALCLLFAAQLVFLPAIIVFLGQDIQALPLVLLTICLVDIGVACSGSLLGALCTGQHGKESLLSLLLFPLLVPLLLAAIRLLAQGFTGTGAEGELGSWLGLSLAFDALFFAIPLVFFPFLYTGDD